MARIPASSPTTPDLVVRGVSKTYGTVTVLEDASITVASGTIHAFVGENGAGKSTLLGAIAGRIAPSAGSISFGNSALGSGRPREARLAGVAAVYQELTVLPAMSAMDNVFLGEPPARSGFLDHRAARTEFNSLADSLGATISPEVPAGSLSVAHQQVLEIMRAVRSGARLLLLDEPTASLAAAERATLIATMRRLASEGISLVFVSHNLDEVLDVSNEITVFRNGRIVDTRSRSRWTKSDLVEKMLGDRGRVLAMALLGGSGNSDVEALAKPGATILDATGVTVPGVIDGLDLVIREGEILGIGGLVGSGRSTLLRALAGAAPGSTGRIVLNGTVARWPRSVRAALRLGMALVPEERKRDGLVLGLGAVPNVTMSDFGSVSRFGWILRGRSLERTRTMTEAYGLPSRMLAGPVGALSGGNQQKLVLARWAHRRPLVLLADEPGRGIDLGAKAQILETLRAFTAERGAVVMVSSEQDELLTFADRILVMAAGQIVAEFDNRRRDITERQVLDAAFITNEETNR